MNCRLLTAVVILAFAFCGCAWIPAGLASANSNPVVTPKVQASAGDQSKVTTNTATTTTSTADAIGAGAKTEGNVDKLVQLMGLTAEERKAQQDQIAAWQQIVYHLLALVVCFGCFICAQITDKHWLEFLLYVVCAILGAYACGMVPALPAFPWW